MRYLVAAADPADLAWLSQRTGWKFTDNATGIVARTRKGETRGVVAYDEWTPNSCRAHVACDTPAAWRALIPACFTYPFLDCDKKLMLVGVSADNARSLDTVRRLGFRDVHAVKDGWSDGVDLHLLEMRRVECRFLYRQAA